MRQRGKTRIRIFALPLIIVFTATIHFLSCMRVVNTVPTNQELFQRYHFSDEDLRKVAFHISNQIVLKTNTIISDYSLQGNAFKLNDDRRDDVYYISVDTRGYYDSTISVDSTEPGKWWELKKKQIPALVVRFNIEDVGNVNMEFVENNEGFYGLRKNSKGIIITSGKTFNCLDGCNSLLLVKAREVDSYQGIDHQIADNRILGKAFWGFLAFFVALYLFSR